MAKNSPKAVTVYGIEFRSIAELCKLLGRRSQAIDVLLKQYGSFEVMAGRLLGLTDAADVRAELLRRKAKAGISAEPHQVSFTSQEKILIKALMLNGLNNFDLVYYSNLTGERFSSERVLQIIDDVLKVL